MRGISPDLQPYFVHRQVSCESTEQSREYRHWKLWQVSGAGSDLIRGAFPHIIPGRRTTLPTVQHIRSLAYSKTLKPCQLDIRPFPLFTMAPKIYTSSYPAVPTYNRSIFTHLFAPHKDPNNVGDYPGTLAAYVDAPTGTVLTRAQLKSLALKLGYGLRNHPSFKAKRGDTIMVYSQNSLTWPVVLFGSGEQSTTSRHLPKLTVLISCCRSTMHSGKQRV